jgi:hypothetical protein
MDRRDIAYSIITITNEKGGMSNCDLSGAFHFEIKNTTGNPAQLEITPTGKKTLGGLESYSFHTGSPYYRFPPKSKLQIINSTITTTLEVTIAYIPEAE